MGRRRQVSIYGVHKCSPVSFLRKGRGKKKTQRGERKEEDVLSRTKYLLSAHHIAMVNRRKNV